MPSLRREDEVEMDRDDDEKWKYLNYLSMPLIISFGIFRFSTRIRFVSNFLHDENVNFSDGLCWAHDEADPLCCSWNHTHKVSMVG